MTPPGAPLPPLLCWQCQSWAAVSGANLTPSKASALICHCSMITAGRSALLPACCHPCSRHIPALRDIPSPDISQLQTHPSSRDIPVQTHPSSRDIPASDCQERTSLPGRFNVGWGEKGAHMAWDGRADAMPRRNSWNGNTSEFWWHFSSLWTEEQGFKH